MPETRSEQFEIKGYAPEPGSGSAEVLSFNRGERAQRALKGLGLSWLVAAGTFFIPVAHLLLVPAFFLFGIYVFVSRMRAEEVATRVIGSCPDCGAAQEFDTGGKWRLPRSLSCGECARTLRAVSGN